MKKLLSLMLVLGLCVGLTGCGSDSTSSESSTASTSEETKEETTLEKVSKVFTLATEETEAGSFMNVAKDGETIRFRMYMSYEGADATVASAMGLGDNAMIYSVDGTDSETYLVDSNKTFVTTTDATAEAMKASMDSYLSEKGITIDELREALKEFK